MLNLSNNTTSGTASLPNFVNCYGMLEMPINISTSMKASAIVNILLSIPTAILAVLGNSIVIYTIYSVKSLQKVSTYLLAYLAINDLLVGAIVLPLNIIARILEVFYQMRCPLEILIKVAAHSVIAQSFFTLTLLAVDQCIAITIPFRHRSMNLAKKFGIALFGFGVLVTLIITSMLIKAFPAKMLRPVILSLISVILCTIAVSYIQIGRVLRNRARAVQGIMHCNSFKSSSKRGAISTGIYVLTFLICVFPRFSIILMEDQELLYHSMRWSAIIIWSRCVFNPLLYFYRKKDFRDAAIRVMRRRGTRGTRLERANTGAPN